MSTYGYDTPGGGPAPAPGIPSGEQPAPEASGQFPPGAPPFGGAPQDDPTAVLGRRIGAWCVDALLLFLLALLFSPFGQFGKHLTETTLDDHGLTLDEGCDFVEDERDVASCGTVPDGVPFLESDRVYYLDTNIALLGTTALLAAVVLIFVVWQGVTGSTPGKQLFRVRVVDERGDPPGLGASLLRTVLWAVDGAPWVVPAVGFVLGLTSTGHRRVGDMAARTFVVDVNDIGEPVDVPGYVPTAVAGPDYRLPLPPGRAPAGFDRPADDFGTAPLPGLPGQPPGPDAAGEQPPADSLLPSAPDFDPSATDQFGEPGRPALGPEAAAPGPVLPAPLPGPAAEPEPTAPRPHPPVTPPVDVSEWAPPAPETFPTSPPPTEPPPPSAAPPPSDEVPADDTGDDLPGWAAGSTPAPFEGLSASPEPAEPEAEPEPEPVVDRRPPPPVAPLVSPTLEPGPVAVPGPGPEPVPEPEPVPVSVEPEPEPAPAPEAVPVDRRPPPPMGSSVSPTLEPGPPGGDPAPVADPWTAPVPSPGPQPATDAWVPTPTPEPEPPRPAAPVPPSEVPPVPEPSGDSGALAEPQPDHVPQGEPVWPAEQEIPEPQPEPTYQPQWDATRGTYIVWEPLRSQWMQWNNHTQEWIPL